MITEYIRLIRISQWAKNAFIFLPLFFGGEIFNSYKFINAIEAFLAFSFLASAIYCLNDVLDAENDKKHPQKKLRPVANGKVTKRSALIIMFFFIVISVVIQFIFFSSNLYFVIVLSIYFIFNILYSTILKYIPIVDVFILSMGFIFRILAGGFATSIIISHWIIIMTFLLALFLSFAKRRDDVVIYESTGTVSRKNINKYNLTFLNQTISIIATITMVSYIMYTVSPDVIERFGSDKIYITAIFVLAGILRYLQITIVETKSGNPTEILLKERFIQACIAGWLITFIFIVYY